MIINKEELEAIQEKIGVKFNDETVLENAFVHRSFLNENRSAGLKNNERLEFLGDAVLELVVTEYLFEKFENKNEGELTSIRSALVKGVTISAVSRDLGFEQAILLSEGEKQGSQKARSLIMANCFEAVIGAIYIDSGIESAKKFIINNLVEAYLDDILENELFIDPKSKFQEIVQEKYKQTPKYQTISQEGPDHDKKFVCGVYIFEKLIAKGSGKSKNLAEQEAASEALKLDLNQIL
ncbi:MAG: Ribonuclease 3 [candidate division WS2 bacterium ADurb.Bin280]|uniref:Ribonuclease 3 n=1 Tax=candidate division WS2 bacterium ADurb.Bin280 TaxID=1852829 RepID=A0A1V5SCD0_9BACT|nr:MAG: Ribonuclease 3 [candidate division WS2 bacterium ADurb.Bin280]